MNLRPLVVVLLALAPLVALAQTDPDPLGPGPHPRAVRAAAPLPADLDEAVRTRLDAYARCAFATRVPADTLRRASVLVTAGPGVRPSVGYTSPVDGAPASLLACVTREVRGAVTASRLRFDGMRTATFEPFQNLPRADIDMPTPQAVLDASASASLPATFAALANDDERLARIANLESSRLAIPVATAVRVLRTITPNRRVWAAVALCRVATGDRVPFAIHAGLSGNSGRWFQAAVGLRCGVTVAAPITGPNGPVECDSNDDCALSCMAPPDCCGGQCGCGSAAPVAIAAANQQACQARREPRHCPAVACAYRQTFAACQAGRCVAVSPADMLRQ